MKTKTLPIVIVTAVLLLSFTATTGWAHGKNRGRYEATTIAVSAAVLVNALVRPSYNSPPAVTYSPTIVYVGKPRPPRRPYWKSHHRHYGKPWKRHRRHDYRRW